MANEKQQVLTQEGYDKLQAELNHLINEERPEVIEQLAAARAQGDLSENADYDAARERQGLVEGRIKEIESILANSKVHAANRNNDKIIGIGSNVTIEDLSDNTTETYKIVGTVESDPMNNKISNDSPLGVALSGHKVDDIVEIKSKHPYKVKVVKIEGSK